MQFVPLTQAIAARVGVALDRPHVAWAGVEDAPNSRGKRSIVLNGQRKRILGMGGLYWREGLCWLWLESVLLERTSALKVMRSAKAMLDKAEQLGETQVFAARDPHPHSEKLLRVLGFDQLHPHPAFGGVEVWRRVSAVHLRKAA